MNIAVVTGASSGMGREFVRILDDYGFDEIWGLALEEDKLEEVKKETKTKFRYFAVDLTNFESIESYNEALKKSKPNILWLVNCSGFCKFGRFDEIPIKSSSAMIDLNCKALVQMTELSLPYMTKGGRIIEIASMAGLQPTPYMSVYGASKAFVLSYSRALNRELKVKKISVTCVCPLWTNTNFQKVARENTASAVTYFSTSYDPKKVIAKAVKDAKKRKEISIYGTKANFQKFLVKILPHRWVLNIWCRQQKAKQKYKD